MTRPGLEVLRPFKNEPELLLEAVVVGSRGVVSERRVVVVGGGVWTGSLTGGLLVTVDFEVEGGVTFGGVYLDDVLVFGAGDVVFGAGCGGGVR